MTRYQYEQIIANNILQTSKDKHDFQPYLFVIPDSPEFITPNSLKSTCQINILAAIISNDEPPLCLAPIYAILQHCIHLCLMSI